MDKYNGSTVLRNADSPENGLVIQNIVVRPTTRRMLDAEKWRNALKAAEMDYPVLVELYDLYDDILLDTMLSTLVEKRIMGVTKNQLLFVDASGQEIPQMAQLLQTRSFQELRKEILLYKFWGRSVIELMRTNGQFSFYSVPRKHIQMKHGRIVYHQYGTDGIDYRKPPYSNYVLEVGRYNDFGLLLKAAPYVIYKRGGFGDWANFAEIFGMPFREGRYDGYNEVARKQLETALENMGNAGYAVLPKEAELKLHEAHNTQGSSELFDRLRQACNQEMAVLILGQTETTTKTTGKLGGNDSSHEHTEDMINLADMRDELGIMNERVRPILANLGYPVQNGTFIHHVEDEKINVKDKVDMYTKLKNEYKLPISDEYIYEQTGIPKPDNYEQLKQQYAAPALATQPTLTPPAAPAPATTPANQATASWAAQFRKALSSFFAQAHES